MPKNKELAELLGMKFKKITETYTGKKYSFERVKTLEKRHNVEFEITKIKGYTYKIEGYIPPNFQKPENFVKLLEMACHKCEETREPGWNFSEENPYKELIQRFINLLSFHPDCPNSRWIKQQAQQTEWVY